MVFNIYKKGQGRYTRLCSAIGGAIIIGLGCLQLYYELEAVSWNLTNRTRIWMATMVPSALFVVLTLLVFLLVNRIRVADFMIAAEGEVKKVSWSSRHEIAVSTFIVIVVVIIMGVILGIADLGFQALFMWFFG